MKRNMLRSALLMLSMVVSAFSFSQTTKILKGQNPPSEIIYKSYPNEYGVIRCHTMERDSIRRMNDTSLPSLEEEEQWLQLKIEEYVAKQNEAVAKGAPKATLLTIPIIFHVITSGSGATNVAQARVQAQLDQLNLDYRGLAGSTNPLNADVEIEFCLATTDPSGNTLTEPGINRITTYGAGPFTDTYVDNTIKPATQWNPNNYFNVWVANLSGGLLGWAQFPSNSGLGGMSANGGAANTDGVVILHTTLGSEASPNPSGTPYNRGRTLTHEAGHWLGLRHIWGDGGCSVDDFCSDTPLSDAANYGCPNTNSCTDPAPNPPDMVQNYMDYTDDACMDIFTPNQVTRMRTVMTVSPRRLQLPNSTVCGSPTANDAGISAVSAPNGTVCGSSVAPVVTLSNFGSNTLTSVTIVYNVDGGTSSNFNWSGSLAQGATTNVTLPVITPSAGPHTFNVYTNNPNGGADDNTSNDAQAVSFTMNPTGSEVNIIISTDCYGEEVQWAVFEQGTSTIVAQGGNLTYTANGTQQATDPSDAGAYDSQVTITETLCLAVDCYDFEIYDSYGDGMYGTQYSGCTSNGDWEIQDGTGAVLDQMTVANSDYGFQDNGSFCLTPPCAATFSYTQTQTELCYGNNTNQIAVSFLSGNSTGATYNIGSGAQASGTFSNLAQGNYTVTVIDGDACTSYVPVTVTGPAQLVVNTTKNNVTCNGLTNGQITVNATGGTSPYSYNVSGTIQGSATFTGLAPNTYTVSVTDNNGCVANGANVTITQPNVLTSTVTSISPELAGNDGGVNITVGGGTTPYSYAWTGSGYSNSVQDPNNMPGGTYNVTVTDANGCTSQLTGIVVPSQLGLDEFGNPLYSIYPNPSNGVFTVSITDPSVDAQIEVRDVTGRVIYRNTEVSLNTQIDLTSFASGNYMLSVAMNDAVYTKRIVLKK